MELIHPEQLVTTEKAAELIGVRRQTITYHAKRGLLRGCLIHGGGKTQDHSIAFPAIDVAELSWQMERPVDPAAFAGIDAYRKRYIPQRVLMRGRKVGEIIGISGVAVRKHAIRRQLKSQTLVGTGSRHQRVYDLEDVKQFAKERGKTVDGDEVNAMKRKQGWRGNW